MSSSKSLTSTTSLPLRFGLEHEHVLIFHESLLAEQLSATDSIIVKDIPPATRYILREGPPQYSIPNPEYQGWGLTGRTNYYGFQLNPDIGYRTYADEILRIENKIFADAGIDVDIHDNEGKRAKFEKWYLSPDWSLIGLTREELALQLPSIPENELQDWDSHGVELISPPLPPTEESFSQIKTYLDVLNDITGLYRAVTTQRCGLHVHIGLPPLSNGDSQPFDLGLLQHLAYILIMYEDAISRLHPPHRRNPDLPSVQIDIRSNRQEMLKEPVFEEEIDFSKPYPEDEEPDLDFAYVREQIFAPGITQEMLASRLCPGGKNHIVNFTYTHRTDGRLRTVEFRQAAGTMDTDDVRHWVVFCVALVGLAERQWRNYGMKEGEVYGGEGYPRREWSADMGVGELLGMMDFEREVVEYFERRAGLYELI